MEKEAIWGGAGGTLFVVSTPIGNLEDITVRALRVLKSVDIIAAEGVNHTRRLCSRHGIHARVVRYNQHNEKTKGPEIIAKLKEGHDIALVSSAGTPGVSDPGVKLASQALEEGIQVSPVPGPSSVTAALSISGMRADRFLFLGFLSPKAGKRKKELEAIAGVPYTMVFFEAPHRIRAMLQDLRDIFGDRRIVLVREMTKVHEEILTGGLNDVLERLREDQIRGEFTLVVSGNPEAVKEPAPGRDIADKIEKLIHEKGLSVRDIADRISSEEGISFRNAYRIGLAVKREKMPTEKE